MPPPGPPPMMPPPPPPAPIAQYQPTYGQQARYAGFWIRVVVRIVDGLIVGIPLSIIFGVIAGIGGGLAAATNNGSQAGQNVAGAAFGGIFVLFYLIAIAVSIGYWVYFWGTTGQTLAMRIFKLRLVDAQTGAPIGMGRALVRWLMTIVNSMACYIGWIWVAFDPRKQGWHDKVANSVVLQD